MLLSAFTLPRLSASLGLPGYVSALALITAGYGLFQAANNTAVMTHGGAEQRGLVSGQLNLSRNLGLITGASFMGALFSRGAATSDFSALAPQAAYAGLTLAFSVAGAFVLTALVIAVRSSTAAQRRSPERTHHGLEDEQWPGS